MSDLLELQPLDEFRYRVPRNEGRGMRTDVVIYASRKLIEQIRKDQSLDQAVNVAMLPGIVGPSLAMPDIHQGYGFPIGGVAALDWYHGVVSPGGVGFDINCGVRLMRSSVSLDQARPKLRDLVNQVFRDIPCGTGREGPVKVDKDELDHVLIRGAARMVERGFGEERDIEFAEERGTLAGADADKVSDRAKTRGCRQLGTIGGGNHFLEIQYVQQIHDPQAARTINLEKNQIIVLVHCGSRGLGHQVCTDYLAQMGDAMKKYRIAIPDRQLACVPIQSPEGQSYLAAMRAAANFAWANRQVILHFLRSSFRQIFGSDAQLEVVYDVCHNIAKRERHQIDGEFRDVLVHRKGATRAFPSGHPDLPEAFREIGQPVLVPGSMGTASWILAGCEESMRKTFGSVCHGAGRLLSRTAAKKGRNAQEIQKQLEAEGIIVRSETLDGILEEIPEAYKDVDEVIEVVHRVGLARKVARLRPIGVIKG
jgi:tRNA-splicing ligase RtcB